MTDKCLHIQFIENIGNLYIKSDIDILTNNFINEVSKIFQNSYDDFDKQDPYSKTGDVTEIVGNIASFFIPGTAAVKGVKAGSTAAKTAEALNDVDKVAGAAKTLNGASKVTKGVEGLNGANKAFDVAKESTEVGKAVGEIEKAGEVAGKIEETGNAAGEICDTNLLDELLNSGVKLNSDDVVMVTKNTNGKIMWLEKGNSKAGLTHILERHAKDFASQGIHDIPKILKEVVETDPIKTGSNAKGLYMDYVLNDNTYRVAYGTNGFVVTFYPID